MDFCHSGGGGPKTQNDPLQLAISTPDFTWAHAFGIYDEGIVYDFSNALFLGWDGDGVANGFQNGQKTSWYFWRANFWPFAVNNYVIVAGDKATNTTNQNPNSINPWDVDGQGRPRMLYSGDGLTTLY